MDSEILEHHKDYLDRKALFQRFGYDIDREREFILGEAKPIRGKILEAGTGKGHFALALAKAGHRFITFDISEEEQRFAKLNLAYFGFETQADFRIENGERTSFAPESFDTIFSVNVLHHLQNPYQVIDELIRLLSPGGKLILADFTEEGFKAIDRIHALEGKTHDAGKAAWPDVERHLRERGFCVKPSASVHQRVLVAEKHSSKP